MDFCVQCSEEEPTLSTIGQPSVVKAIWLRVKKQRQHFIKIAAGVVAIVVLIVALVLLFGSEPTQPEPEAPAIEVVEPIPPPIPAVPEPADTVEDLTTAVEYIYIHGVQFSTSLTELTLRFGDYGIFSAISDSCIEPLQYMTNLTSLTLITNIISDLTPLSELTNLTSLTLASTQISDLTPLSALTNLTELHLRENNISDLNPLAELTNLTFLNLGGNNISDLAPLAELTNLTALVLWRNNISDLRPLSGLTNLTHLSLISNSISDLAPLSELANLILLHLENNNISDLTPLSELSADLELHLDGNPITDWSPVSHISLVEGRILELELELEENPRIAELRQSPEYLTYEQAALLAFHEFLRTMPQSVNPIIDDEHLYEDIQFFGVVWNIDRIMHGKLIDFDNDGISEMLLFDGSGLVFVVSYSENNLRQHVTGRFTINPARNSIATSTSGRSYLVSEASDGSSTSQGFYSFENGKLIRTLTLLHIHEHEDGEAYYVGGNRVDREYFDNAPYAYLGIYYIRNIEPFWNGGGAVDGHALLSEIESRLLR